jgi:DsbC/DsbD-like thiol-disulfide interchange protein
MPPSVEWTLPEGVTVGPLQFPIPRRIDAGGGLVSFGYEDELVLLAKVTTDASVKGPIQIKGKLNWLVCKSVCVAESAEASASVQVADATAERDARFNAWRARLPRDGSPREGAGGFLISAVTMNLEKTAGSLRVHLPPGERADLSRHDLFPPALEHAAFEPPQVFNSADGSAVIVPFRVLPGMTKPVTDKALFVRRGADGAEQGFLLDATFDFTR